MLRVADLKELETSLPRNVVVVRAKSSWITVELLIVLLEMLRQALDSNGIKQQPVLLLDCCPVHLHARVWRTAKKNYINLCFVPATLTWLLQPLDVMILRRLKSAMRGFYRRSQITNGSACVPVVDTVKNLTHAIRKVLQGHAWGPAFDACGYSNTTSMLTSALKKLFAECGGCGFQVPRQKPETELILEMLPRKRKYEIQALFWDHTPPVAALDAVAAHVTTSSDVPVERQRFPMSSAVGFPRRYRKSDTPVDMCCPIASRTRSRSRLTLSAEDSQPLGFGGSTASAECPSSMPVHPAPAPPQVTPVRRPRARALPFPRRPPTA